MSLSRKLFLLVGGLLCLLLAGQLWLFRTLSRDVSQDVRKVAFQVGEDIVSGFSFRTGSDGSTAGEEGEAAAGKQQMHVVVLSTDGPVDASGQVLAVPPAFGEAEKSAPGEPPVRFRRELHWKTRDGKPVTELFERREALSPEESQRFSIAADTTEDRLFVRSPSLERAIPIPHDEVASTLDRFGSRLFLGSVALLALGLAATALLAHRMSRPLAELAHTAERVGTGELGLVVAEPRGGARDEVGRAVASFNSMSHRLAELDHENRRLAEAEQLSELGEVARGLAHSLRNPLNALGLTIERLGARAGDDESASGLVDGSRRQIRRIDGALRSFLALASAGAAQSQAVDVAALAREVVLEALQDVRRGARIEVDSAAGERLEVLGVDAELKAVLQALVVNACEAAAAGGDGAQVVVHLCERSGGGVRVEVRDNGSGVSGAVRERLFEPHVTTKPHGSGMGLFLAHRLATARYGGALRLEDGETGGTVAILELGDRRGSQS